MLSTVSLVKVTSSTGTDILYHTCLKQLRAIIVSSDPDYRFENCVINFIQNVFCLEEFFAHKLFFNISVSNYQCPKSASTCCVWTFYLNLKEFCLLWCVTKGYTSLKRYRNLLKTLLVILSVLKGTAQDQSLSMSIHWQGTDANVTNVYNVPRVSKFWIFLSRTEK